MIDCQRKAKSRQLVPCLDSSYLLSLENNWILVDSHLQVVIKEDVLKSFFLYLSFSYTQSRSLNKKESERGLSFTSSLQEGRGKQTRTLKFGGSITTKKQHAFVVSFRIRPSERPE